MGNGHTPIGLYGAYFHSTSSSACAVDSASRIFPAFGEPFPSRKGVLNALCIQFDCTSFGRARLSNARLAHSKNSASWKLSVKLGSAQQASALENQEPSGPISKISVKCDVSSPYRTLHLAISSCTLRYTAPKYSQLVPSFCNLSRRGSPAVQVRCVPLGSSAVSNIGLQVSRPKYPFHSRYCVISLPSWTLAGGTTRVRAIKISSFYSSLYSPNLPYPSTKSDLRRTPENAGKWL